MKQCVTLVLLFLLHAFAKAQVTLQPILPATGMIQKDQLWNILVINNTGVEYNCRIDMLLKDRISGQEFYTATTNTFPLGKGAKQLNANALNPIQYNDAVSSFNTKLQGLLPIGSYLACYSLVAFDGKAFSLADECVPVDVEPLSPPMLASPSDSTISEVRTTQFSWIPPAPLGIFNGLNYELIITELNEGQRADEALQQNIPFYNTSNLFSNSFIYPASAPQFEKDKWYAWQVIAKDNQNYACKSESWVFKATSIPVNQVFSNNSYVSLNQSAGGQTIFYAQNNLLNIKYHSYEAAHKGEIKLYGPNKQLMKKVKQDILYGDNLITVHLGNRFIRGQVYSVELLGLDGKKYEGLFSIKE